MRFRSTSVRTKVTALLVSLAALWAFAAWVTLRDGLDLFSVSTIDQNVTRPAVSLVTELQKERRLSTIYLGAIPAGQRQALTAQRKRTDDARAKFQRLASSGSVSRSSSSNLDKRIKEAFTSLGALDTGRAAIDAGRVDRAAAVTPFSNIIDAAFRIFASAGSLDDAGISKDSRTLNTLIRAKEIVSREDALLAGVLAAGRISAAEQAQFIELSGTQKFLQNEAVAELPSADRARYQELVSGSAYVRFRALESLVIQKNRPKGRPPVTAGAWESAVQAVLDGLEDVVLKGGDDLVERAKPIAIGVIIRLILAGGLGLLAVIASVVLSITTARALVRQLELLKTAAWELANSRLPGVVERLGHGENVDVAAEAPPLEFGDDAIGQVGRAFNAVQETAIRTAVEQAELRRGIRDILLSLARRTQTLVHRQLNLLDAMERRETGTDELEDLFRVDHLATRMRRNAENLIVLSGSTPARGWRRSVPMLDVVRGAVAEVEDYERVTVQPIGPVALAGRAVGDVTHLLAELIENAISFSPSYTSVQVGGHMAASGFVIEVEDSGLGMSDDNIEEANTLIADPPEFNLSSTARLGLYVVSKLAERYRIRVSIKHSAYGGTTAVVLIPRDLVTEGDDEDALVAAPATQAQAQPQEQGQAQAQTGTATAVRETTGTAATTVTADPPRPAVPSQRTNEDGEPAKPPMTKRGLPMRIPQASLAPPLRADPPQAPGHTDEEPDEGRSPEEIRAFMGAYQKGTLKGRSDAARQRADDDTDDEGSPPGPPADDEPQA